MKSKMLREPMLAVISAALQVTCLPDRGEEPECLTIPAADTKGCKVADESLLT